MISQSASAMALVPFVSVENVMRLILKIGVEQCLTELTEHVEADFRRWDQFDRKPRVASHSSDGVIVLMPTSDGSEYGFKYVNGHTKTPARVNRRLRGSECSRQLRQAILF